MYTEKTNKNFIIKKSAVYSIVCGLLALLIIVATSPAGMPAAMLLVLPIVVSGLIYNLLVLTITYFLPVLMLEQVKIISLFGILFPGFIFMLASLTKLGSVDIMLSLLLSAGVVSYLYKLKSAKVLD